MRTIVFTLVGVAACVDPPDLQSDESEVIIGSNDLQPVGLYTPKPGSPFWREFVAYHEPAVGLLTSDGGGCTGTLIGSDLFLTAAHCINDDIGTSGTVQFNRQTVFVNGDSQGLAPVDTFPVSQIVECGEPSWCGSLFNVPAAAARDFAILRLGPIGDNLLLAGDKYPWKFVAPRDPAVLEANAEPIAVIQHPGGIPKVVDTGTVSSWVGPDLKHNADALLGTSGSAVLDSAGAIVSLTTHENAADNYGPAMRDLVAASRTLRGPIPGNTYQLVKAGTHKCLDVPGFSKATGQLIAEHVCKQTGYLANQEVRARGVGVGFQFVMVDAQKCWEIPSSVNGTAIQQVPCEIAPNQIWDVEETPLTGYFQIKSRLNPTMCVYLDPAEAQPRLKITTCGTEHNQRWRFDRTAKSYQVVFNPTSECLDIPSFSKASGVAPQRHACKTSPMASFNQEFAFVVQSDGAVQLRNEYSRKCLQVQGGSTAQGALVEQADCVASQRWFVDATGSGTFKLRNAASNKCLDFYTSSFRQYTCGSYPEQQYRLAKGFH